MNTRILTFAAAALCAAWSLPPSTSASGAPSTLNLTKYGPPLICFQYDIGDAKSLPWNGSRDNPFGVNPEYDVANLTEDTIKILDSSSDVLVHMETLRRATFYASQSDGKPAKGRDAALTTKLTTLVLHHSLRKLAADPNYTLAWVDAGYALGAAEQLTNAFNRNIKYTDHFDKAAALAPSDPAVLFASSAGHLDSPDNEHWAPLFEKAYNFEPQSELLRSNIAAYGERYLGKDKMKELAAAREARIGQKK
ncbi:MAG: hypothetical protein HY286_08885 [Planctomycetes bacterium]|nr:hypothetical protein [Planctomycetota bacterium]